jgi:hypothetical protein
MEAKTLRRRQLQISRSVHCNGHLNHFFSGALNNQSAGKAAQWSFGVVRKPAWARVGHAVRTGWAQARQTQKATSEGGFDKHLSACFSWGN